MTKKFKPSKPLSQAQPAPRAPLFTRRGKVTMAAGAALAALGFFVVTLTDPAGQNWASNLCPFLILGGYTLIGVGIVLPDPEPKP
jgi:hypothetical protein